jgi:hypothetical protein
MQKFHELLVQNIKKEKKEKEKKEVLGFDYNHQTIKVIIYRWKGRKYIFCMQKLNQTFKAITYERDSTISSKPI